MYELIDYELDAVTGAAGNFNGNAAGLVAVGVNVSDVSVLNGNTVNVLNGSLNGNSVPIGAAVAVLGTAANVISSTA